MSGGRPPSRSSKFGDGTTSATMKESGEKAGMGRMKPVARVETGDHSLRQTKKARIVNVQVRLDEDKTSIICPTSRSRRFTLQAPSIRRWLKIVGNPAAHTFRAAVSLS